MDWGDKIAGTILGMAVGDALGLPFEGMSPERIQRILGVGPLRHSFVFGRGMTSDDTEHACMTAQALLAVPEDPEGFGRSLAWRLRGWILGLPAGVGWATLRGILRLWSGCSPEHSGVNSAGNGPAMRAPVLGACLGRDPERLRSYVRASTRLTHLDPRAEEGAYLVALAAAQAARRPEGTLEPKKALEALRREVKGRELKSCLDLVSDGLEKGLSPAALAGHLGLSSGVTGYMNHTVPVALFCWLRFPCDFQKAVEAVVHLGGDTDTTGAIVGALSGATLGATGIPRHGLDGLMEWPRSVPWMETLAARLATRFGGQAGPATDGPLSLFWPGIVPRNLLFMALVLGHGLRRLLPL